MFKHIKRADEPVACLLPNIRRSQSGIVPPAARSSLKICSGLNGEPVARQVILKRDAE